MKQFPFYTNLIYRQSSFKIKTYQEVNRGELIDFINNNSLATIKLNEALFDEYIIKKAKFLGENFTVLLDRSKIVGIATVEEDIFYSFGDQKEAIISTFFVQPEIKTDRINTYILDYLIRSAKRRGYLRLRIAKGFTGVMKNVDFRNESGALSYFLKRGFKFYTELYNMILEKKQLTEPTNIKMIYRKLENNEMIIRDYKKDDYSSLTKLIKTEFPHWVIYSKKIFNKIEPDLKIIIAEYHSEIVGFNYFSLGTDEEFTIFKLRQILDNNIFKQKLQSTGCFHIMGIQEKWRGKGIGSTIVLQSIENLISKGANLIAISTVLPSFFERFGFKTIEKYINLGMKLA